MMIILHKKWVQIARLISSRDTTHYILLKVCLERGVDIIANLHLPAPWSLLTSSQDELHNIGVAIRSVVTCLPAAKTSRRLWAISVPTGAANPPRI